jgi:lysophospholipase L1-like esterase
MNERLWKVCLVSITAVLLLAVYLNRAYAHIYDTVGGVGLKAPVRSDFYEKTGEPQTKIAFIGDSLTAGVGAARFEDSYPYQFGKRVAAEKAMYMTVHAVPGYKAAEALRDLVPLTVQDDADVVFVLIGANDVHGQTSLADFKQTYEAILKALEGRPGRRVYALTIPKIGSPHLLYPPYNWYFHWRTDTFNDVIANLAEAHGATLVDFAQLTETQLTTAGNWYSTDEFHPSGIGYGFWSTVIYAAYSR